MPRPPLRVRWRARRANGRTRRSCRWTSAAPFRPVRSCGRSWRSWATVRRRSSLDRLKIGEAGGVMLEGAGDFDRVNATGKLALDSSAASLGQITGLIAPLAPALASRLDSMRPGPGPARLKLALDVDSNSEAADRANARAVLDLDAPQLKGTATITATPETRGAARDRSRLRSGAANSASNRNCRRSTAAPCWSCSGSIASSPRARARRNSRDR